MPDLQHPMFDWTTTSDGVVVLTMDDTGNAANIVNQRFRHDFPVVLDRLEAERASITGVVLRSAKPTFFAGADLSEFAALGDDAVAATAAMLDELKAHFRRLETLGLPVVAAIAGAALGGGYELALACHRRIVVDDPRVLVGLPESRLGLLPGAGGVVRTVRMFGVAKAVTEILVPGTRYTPDEALRAGLVDEKVADADQLLAAACRWIAANPHPRQPWDTDTGTRTGLQGAWLLPAELIARTHGAPAEAAEAILAVAVEGARLDFATAQTLESRRCAALIASTVSSNIIESTFFGPRRIRRARRSGPDARRAASVPVVGAGPVAAEIARAWTAAGLDVATPAAPGTGPVDDDRPGFYATRILAARLDEAMCMVLDGVPAPSIERAALQAGYPVGPLALADTLSLPVLARIDGEIHPGTDGSSALGTVCDRMVAHLARPGRAAGAGFYDYADGERTRLWDGLPVAFGTTRHLPGLAELTERLLVREALEAQRAVADRVVDEAEADVAAVLGVGFPAWTGGCLRFVDQFPGGPRGFAARCTDLADRHGDRFRPAAAVHVGTGR